MGWIEHVGLNVPDVEAALAYYDELMPLFGYVRHFPTGYVPTDWKGTQIFIYPAVKDGPHSRLRTGLSHLAFLVATREEVDAVHRWAVDRAHEILNPPKPFPEYGEHCYATFFVDRHDFMIEATCHTPPSARP
jgi:catechol 2,3-dioxygenase-like lactoylglutathione lyase family enzyme